MSKTSRDLLTYAAVGAAATPMALMKGELAAAIFVVAALAVIFFWRNHFN